MTLKCSLGPYLLSVRGGEKEIEIELRIDRYCAPRLHHHRFKKNSASNSFRGIKQKDLFTPLSRRNSIWSPICDCIFYLPFKSLSLSLHNIVSRVLRALRALIGEKGKRERESEYICRYARERSVSSSIGV